MAEAIHIIPHHCCYYTFIILQRGMPLREECTIPTVPYERVTIYLEAGERRQVFRPDGTSFIVQREQAPPQPDPDLIVAEGL